MNRPSISTRNLTLLSLFWWPLSCAGKAAEPLDLVGIGPEGGLVASGPPSVDVPEGAMNEHAELSIVLDESDYEPFKQVGLVGPAYSLLPLDQRFSKEVTVVLPYDAAASDLIVLKRQNEEDETWSVVEGATFDSGEATFEVKLFGIYAVAGTLADGADEPSLCDVFCSARMALACPEDPSSREGCQLDCETEVAVTPAKCLEDLGAFYVCAEAEDLLVCNDEGLSDLPKRPKKCETELESLEGCVSKHSE